MALAEIEGLEGSDDQGPVAVRTEHVAKVVEMSKLFKSYLEGVHHRNADDLAYSMGNRNDPPNRDSAVHGADGPF